MNREHRVTTRTVVRVIRNTGCIGLWRRKDTGPQSLADLTGCNASAVVPVRATACSCFHPCLHLYSRRLGLERAS